MSLQHSVQPRSSANGIIGRRRVDRETGTKTESKMLSGKSPNNFGNAGVVNGGKVRGFGSPSHDRLIYIMTCLIGHPVEVGVKNGSVIAGIFYAANTEKDFGIVLNMARVIKDGLAKGQRPLSEAAKRPQTMIIPAREFIYMTAKDVSLTSDDFLNEHTCDKRRDLMIDAAISQSHHLELERELKPWAPDEDYPEHPELENVFDGGRNSKWDQFEANETLFGVKSTFNEEIYTTKLERGPQTRDLERLALRIAREIEGEDTEDLHLAEERGLHFHNDFDLDEETRFSAVRREIDDGRFEQENDPTTDSWNAETFGGSLSFINTRSYSNALRKKVINEAQASSTCLSRDEDASFQVSTNGDEHISSSVEHVGQLESDITDKNFPFLEDERVAEEQIGDHNEGAERTGFEEPQTSKTEGSADLLPPNSKKGLSPSAVAFAPSGQEGKHSTGESSESAVGGGALASVEPLNQSLRPGSSASTFERVGAGSISTGPALSPSSSVGSLSSEKSTLNPHAKEFKLNPNAKSFTPSSPLRPPTPVSEGFYYANNMPAIPPMHSLPVGIGIGPAFGGHQPVVYNPQAAQVQSPQAYIHPNGPMYGQQMILGQPRQVLYMPSYPPDMQYKGRNF